MKKVLTILGARPQFIKAATVSRVIRGSKTLKEVIVHTGQHFDFNMSDIFFKEMEIPLPDYNLEINSMNHGAMTGRMLEKTEEVMLTEKPDMVMVYGDTNSTLAGALAASKLHIKVAHVEAGLRSFNMIMPEEINRIITDRISDLLFCPTDNAVKNLIKEGYQDFNAKILKVGDVMYDAALFYSKQSAQNSNVITRLDLQNKSFVLSTIHRQENTDTPERLLSIIAALNEIHQVSNVVLPLHPRTKNIIQNNHIRLSFNPIEPVSYFDMIELMKHCDLVITDSGGMQKEAFFYKKYCITLRDQTEWTELADHGFNSLTGADKNKIIEGFHNFSGKTLENTPAFYGTGNAGKMIVESIIDNI